MTGELPPRARLLAVSKGHPAASIRAVASLGQQAFGESRLQEAVEKQALLSDLPLQWHFIGRLQRNKVPTHGTVLVAGHKAVDVAEQRGDE